MDAREYEQYIARLVREMECFRRGTIHVNRRFQGVRQPGEYEIDVAVEMSLGNMISFLLIIECKNWSRPVDRPVVQKLAQTRDAIAAQKAAVVSPKGFTREAVEVARVHGIALWVIAEGNWHMISGARGAADWLREYEQLRLDLLKSLDVHVPRLHVSAVVRFSEAAPVPGGGALGNNYAYECRMGGTHTLHSCTLGIDGRTAISEIANAVFLQATRGFDDEASGIVGAANAWRTRAEEQLAAKLGLEHEAAALAAGAVAGNDVAQFRSIVEARGDGRG